MDMSRDEVPQAIETMDGAAQRLHISMRRLRDLVKDTPLATTRTVALGHSVGTYRLWPALSVALLRQFLAAEPWYAREWRAAIEEMLASTAWQRATRLVARVPARPKVGGQSARQRMDAVLTSDTLRSAMYDLYSESLDVLDRWGLGSLVDIDTMIVDRIGDEHDAVILLGAAQEPYMLPTAVLKAAGLDREKARGFLMATYTSEGVALDAWPMVGVPEEWQPDPDLMRHLVEVGA